MKEEVKLKAALFDLDGVVFDTEPQYTIFWGRQCLEFHPDVHGLEKRIKGQTLVKIFSEYFSGPLETVRPTIMERLYQFERTMSFDYLNGFVNLVEDLKFNKVHTAVVTSSNKAKMNSVYSAHPEFTQLFDIILTSEDFTESKPHPECYLKAASLLNVTTEECLVFEDSFNGLHSGKAAGMKVVGVASTNSVSSIAPYSDLVVEDYNDLCFDTCNRILKH